MQRAMLWAALDSHQNVIVFFTKIILLTPSKILGLEDLSYAMGDVDRSLNFFLLPPLPRCLVFGVIERETECLGEN